MSEAKMEFDYIDNVPIIRATVTNKDKEMSIYFFVDSGADITMIPISAAKRLGFTKWDNKLLFAEGVGGGKIPYFIRKVNISVGNKKFESEIACALSDDVPFLFGRKLFNGTICFNEKRKKIIFNE